jgi:predicted nucleic acid-binding protein
MFAASPAKIKQYQETGACGNESLDYAIDLLLRLGEGGYSTSELALLETVSVASRLGGQWKAETLFGAVIAQESFQILETKALAYPLSFAFTLENQLEARDSLHLAVATLSGVNAIITSDTKFADSIESMTKHVVQRGFRLPTSVRGVYRLTRKQASIIEEQVTPRLSILSVDRAPA